MLRKIILLGGGGHCVSCIDVIESTGLYKIHGILDVQEKVGQKVLGYPIIGTDSDVEQYAREKFCFIVTAGQIKSPTIRKRLYGLVKKYDGEIETIIASSARVSSHTSIGEGSMIMHNAFVNAGCQIGINCIINSNSLIEHTSHIGNHVHISTNATINGDCVINSETFIGSNSVINQGITVAANVIVGSGSVVTKNILLEGTYVGNPVRKLGD